MSFEERLNNELPADLAHQRDLIRGYALDYGLSFFEVLFECVNSDQINSLAALGGFPVRYPHWRFGMQYDQLDKTYSWGFQRIYEMVINTNPVYAYLLKSNRMVDQKTVMAHVYGHADFFKNNIWFSKTDRKMLDVMANHSVKVRGFMDRLGQDKVENFLDQCLALENLIDPHLVFSKSQPKYKRFEDEEQPISSLGLQLPNDRSYMNPFINPPQFLAEQKQRQEENFKKKKKIPSEPAKDVLGFLLEHAPLELWEQEIVSLIRSEAYYFVPQAQTKIMNEGWASFWHSKIMTEKSLESNEILDFAEHHAGTLATQPGQINPYKLGIELFRDIKERWDKGKFGKAYEECDDLVQKANWDQKLGLGFEKIFQVRTVCNDVTFIDEYLTEEFVQRFQLYSYVFNRRKNQHEIESRDFFTIKQKLLSQLTNLGQPMIEVLDGNFENRGELLLVHRYQGVSLDLKWAKETLNSVQALWRRPVHLETEINGQPYRLSYQGNSWVEKCLA